MHTLAQSKKIPINNIDGSKVTIEVSKKTKKIKAKQNRIYHWMKAKKVMETQGGYSGKLLHGEYLEFYKNHQLKAKGTFKNGLKKGIWTYWDKVGKITTIEKWRKGEQKELKKKTINFSKIKLKKERKETPIKENSDEPIEKG